MTTGRGFAFPRIALVLPPGHWERERRDAVISATRPVARTLGMTKHKKWSVHWRMLDPIAESQTLEAYSDECVAALYEAASSLAPVVEEAIESTRPPGELG